MMIEATGGTFEPTKKKRQQVNSGVVETEANSCDAEETDAENDGGGATVEAEADGCVSGKRSMVASDNSTN